MWVSPHHPPRGEKSLSGETSREAYSAPSARGSWRLGRCERFCWSSARLRWGAVGAVLSPFQYIHRLHSVGRDSDMSAAHDNCVLSGRAITSCGPLYGGSKARRMASYRRNTWVGSPRSLWMNVVGYPCRAAGVGRSWFILWWSCFMKADVSTFGAAATRSSPGTRRGSPYPSSAADDCKSSL